ncbi:MAG TPA: ABC transporter permease, partial [Jiangellaceae bacterium]|nr:ABC transporter permease [Jiangellaceae bacterium]
TFYPLSTYPDVLQRVVQVTPLYHGVALVRDLMLGDLGTGVLVHVGYLAGMGLVGAVFAARRVERLLLT